MESSYEVYHLNNISIENFLINFRTELFDIIKKFKKIKKKSLHKEEEEKIIKLHHEEIGKEKSKAFVGRIGQILYIKEKLADFTVSHIVIHGESGCGKTR